MTDETKEFPLDAHKKFAVDLFNHAWGLIDKKDRTPDEDDEMIWASNASAYHWSMLKGHIDDLRWQQSTPRSHNQLANVFIAMGRAEPAIFHAQRCVDLCIERGIADFDIAFGYHCLAWAYDVAGDTEKRDANLKLAYGAVDGIEKDGDKNFFLEELKKVPGAEAIMAEA